MNPDQQRIYDEIVRVAKTFGPVVEDPKKTSIHLVRRTAFAGVATRKEGLMLTLKSGRNIEDARIHKAEQTSANRWHLEVHVKNAREVDGQLKAWMRSAYELAG